VKTKTFGPFAFKIDRPKGFTKEWPGGKTFTYPCDYGYFPRLMGEDEEGLDVFVGDDPNGHLESFQKLRREGSKLVPDETKFLLGVTDAEREAIYRLYGLEVNARRVYDNVDQLGEALKRFEPKKKRAMKSAAYLYGVKLAGIAEAFTALGRFPSSFQGSDHTEAEILKAQTETPALFATQPNLKAMQMASDPYGMGMMGGGMGGGMAPPVHHRHRHHR
jgi:hypothetical protein